MPAQPLLDFDALDLSKPVAPLEEIRARCKQRGRLALIDAVVHVDIEGRLVVGYKDLKADDWWAEDHIPGRPIFPGVLMIEGAAQLCTFDYVGRTGEDAAGFVGFGGVDRARFRGQALPGQRLYWAVRAERLRKTMFTYTAQGFVDHALIFESQILGVVV